MLTVVMVLLAFSSFAQAADNGTIAGGAGYDVTETFDYESISDMTTNGRWIKRSGVSGATLENGLMDGDTTKSLKLIPARAGAEMYDFAFEKRTNGVFSLSFDAKFTDLGDLTSATENHGMKINLVKGADTGTYGFSLIKINKEGKVFSGSTNMGTASTSYLGTVINDKIYNFSFSFDLTNGKMLYGKVAEQETGDVVANVPSQDISYVLDKDSTDVISVKSIDSIRFSAINYKDQDNSFATLIDNIRTVYSRNQTVFEGISDDFNSYYSFDDPSTSVVNLDSAKRNKLIAAGYTFKTNGTYYWVNEENNIALKLTPENNDTQAYLRRPFSSVSSGLLKISFKLKKEAGKLYNTDTQTYDGNTTNSFAYFSLSEKPDTTAAQLLSVNANNDIKIGWNTTSADGSLDNDVWYKCDFEINIDESKVTGKVTKISDSSVIVEKTRTISFGDTGSITTIGNLNIVERLYKRANAGILVDDLSITHSYSAPELKSYKFYDMDDVEQSDVRNMSPTTSKVVLDFGTLLDIDSISYDTVALKRNDGTPVSHTATVDGGVITLTFDECLGSNTEYTLCATEGLKNVAGDEASANEVPVKTMKGMLQASFTGVKVGDAELTSISQIVAQSKIQATLSLTNTTGEAADCRIIFGYYSGTEMIGVSVEELPLGTTMLIDSVITSDENTVIPAFSEGKTPDRMKAFFWNGLSLVPIADCYAFPANN